ncbi:MAG: undecaprenyl-diphosphate phosphatase [Patescibacteria group bacterium]|jgi:undecaprenyl-diphosphatase
MFEAIILGAIQGLTEFLPVSSSGHLVLIPYIFNWHYNGLSFDVALHAGTAIALLLFFWRDWVLIIKNSFTKSSTREILNSKYPKNFLWQIAVASIPAMIVGLTIDKYVENNFHFILLIAINLALFGWLLWFVDKKSKSDLSLETITFKKSFIIGLFQAFALIPGVSRSGITITASRLVGLSREPAARFSFLLATPAIVGAFLLKVPDILEAGFTLNFFLGVATATIFGLAAIKFLLVYLKKSDFSLFMWYRLILAVAVVVIFLLKYA